MENDLRFLISTLKNNKRHLEEEKAALVRRSNELSRDRTAAAVISIAQLLPDLKMSTVKALLVQVPHFSVPTVSLLFGIGRKVAPEVKLSTLRIQLGTYLDNTQGTVPKIWAENVLVLDAAIRELQAEHMIENGKHITELNRRIAALENLLRADIAKMDVGIQTRLAAAVGAQIKTTWQMHNISGRTEPIPTTYPSPAQINSSRGPSVLEMWLWWQILSPDTEYMREVARLESPITDFDSRSTNNMEGGHSDTTSTTDEAQLDVQAELGSQSFS